MPVRSVQLKSDLSFQISPNEYNRNVVWDPSTKTDIKGIEGVQRKALQFIYHAYGSQVSISDLLSR